ncbi:uncharacterized protein si:ch211-119e14.1 [Erpetoichthys calabaricus]|uniref:uncharacterized protein si:ch211-119e14.1 n=1 Tax=Erpetoichthys calabaricus TaxID=27687 RepID=UPI002234B1B0|nr:uncharacterized protein si:ch211-119e14.1 [Erpetoichthys calabaricus]
MGSNPAIFFANILITFSILVDSQSLNETVTTIDPAGNTTTTVSPSPAQPMNQFILTERSSSESSTTQISKVQSPSMQSTFQAVSTSSATTKSIVTTKRETSPKKQNNIMQSTHTKPTTTSRKTADIKTIPSKRGTIIIVVLILLLIFLILLFIYFYRLLNKRTKNAYCVSKLIHPMQQRVTTFLSPFMTASTSREELHDEEEGEDTESSHKQHAPQGQESDVENNDNNNDNPDSDSDDYSSMDGCDLRERAKLMMEAEEEEKAQQKKGQAGEGGLLADLHAFSGSAVWSEEKSEDGAKGSEADITAL